MAYNVLLKGLLWRNNTNYCTDIILGKTKQTTNKQTSKQTKQTETKYKTNKQTNKNPHKQNHCFGTL